MGERPRIVCLCGSTRFYRAFQEANYRETMAGRIVLTVGFYPHAQDAAHGEDQGCTPEQKAALDELHKRKIDLADEVLVLNVKAPRCTACAKWLLTKGMQFDFGGNTSLCCQRPCEFVGYIGDSTRSEIKYARACGKPVRWLEPEETT